MEAALQYSTARRQNLSLHQADRRKISQSVCDQTIKERRIVVFRALLPGKFGAPPGAFHSSPFSGAVLQSGSDAVSHAPLLAVSHSPLPGTLRPGINNGRAIRRGRAQRAAVFGGTASRSGGSIARADGIRSGGDTV